MGPAVISTCRPAKIFLLNRPAVCSSICTGSANRPSPISPHACQPLPGWTIWVSLNLLILARFFCVACLAHISLFIAGATMRGDAVAKKTALSRSLADPLANLAKTAALAGAIIRQSAQRAS